MFEILTVICDLIIAFAGLVFVIVEYKNKQKSIHKITKERETIQTLVDEAEKISEYLRESKQYLENFEKASKTNSNLAEEKLKLILGDAENYYKNGMSICDSTEKVYRQLLKCEEDFSFSYGFDRMINACRELLIAFNLKDHLNTFFSLANTTYSYVKEIERNGGYLTDKNRKDLGLYAQQLYKSILKITEELTNFKSYMLETKKKLEAMDSDTN